MTAKRDFSHTTPAGSVVTINGLTEEQIADAERNLSSDPADDPECGE